MYESYKIQIASTCINWNTDDVGTGTYLLESNDG